MSNPNGFDEAAALARQNDEAADEQYRTEFQMPGASHQELMAELTRRNDEYDDAQDRAQYGMSDATHEEMIQEVPPLVIVTPTDRQ